MRKFGVVLASCGVMLMAVTASLRAEDASGRDVEFRSGNSMLRGVVYKPEGKGPFPAVVYERAVNKPVREATPVLKELAEFYTSHGFVFFITSRRSNAELEASSASETTKAEKRGTTLPEYEQLTKDVAAAVSWIKLQSYADENKIVVVGQAAGATAALLLAEQDVDVRAVIAFSPAAQEWTEQPSVAHALADAIKEAKSPVFIIQAQNDSTLAPSEFLGKEIMAKGKPNTCKVYPPFDTAHSQAAAFSYKGSSVWGADVASFLYAVLKM